MGTVVSALGVYLSVKVDLPTGATIVCTFGVVLILMGALRGVIMRAVAAKNALAAGTVRAASQPHPGK